MAWRSYLNLIDMRTIKNLVNFQNYDITLSHTQWITQDSENSKGKKSKIKGDGINR